MTVTFLQHRFGITFVTSLQREFQNTVVNDEKNHIFSKNISRDKKYFFDQNFFDFRNQIFFGTYILGDVARVKFSAPTDE